MAGQPNLLRTSARVSIKKGQQSLLIDLPDNGQDTHQLLPVRMDSVCKLGWLVGCLLFDSLL
jgi:hypothetical protein